MMRLTLRTLLAYLDDVLEPADTKIIGQKIQESPMAQLLVSRIREVMRRRRLRAPEVFGPEMGIDPNIVAQYLDNTLHADQYADVERVFLASDEMLAEAAACHEVLTVDPPEVSLETRERLYALGPVEAASQLVVSRQIPEQVSDRVPESIPIRNGASLSSDRTWISRQVKEESITTVPDYLKPAPWTRRLFPSALVALLVVISGALLAPELWTRFRQANSEIQRKDVRDKNAISDSSDDTFTAEDSRNHPVEIASNPPASAIPFAPSFVDGKPLLPGLDPNPPQDELDDLPAPTPSTDVIPQPGKKGMTAKSAPDESAVAVSRKPESAIGNEVTSKPVPQVLEPVKEMPITYTSNDGVLLRFDPALNHWYMVPHRSSLKPGEVIANVEPFEGTLDVDKGSLKATLIGETVVNLLVPGEAGISGLRIQRGQLLIQNTRPDDNEPTSVGIAIGQDVWRLELASNETICGLEVTPNKANQFQKLQDEHWYQATLYVISGSVKWISPAGKSQDVGDYLALNIIPEKSAQVRSSPISFPSAPDWCDSVKRRAMPIRKHQSQIQFEKTFELDQPVEESMLNLVKHSKYPKIAELAAQCLCATDDYAALVETLAECPHEEARFAARDGLRLWLPVQADRGLKLKMELESRYPPADAEVIYQMLWGFSREDVTNSKPNSWLFINAMRSPKPEIRELADFWVEFLTGKKTEFRALGGTAAQREAQVRRLEEQIERNNGLIKAQ